jgi:hypothetical protein
MKTIITYTEDPDDYEMRAGLSDKLKDALKAIEAVANEPFPSNQLALRTYYTNQLNQLAVAFNAISSELYETFDESYRKRVYDERDTNFVNSVIQEIGYEIQQGGKRTRTTRRRTRCTKTRQETRLKQY